jgi:hypothetical protein
MRSWPLPHFPLVCASPQVQFSAVRSIPQRRQTSDIFRGILSLPHLLGDGVFGGLLEHLLPLCLLLLRKLDLYRHEMGDETREMFAGDCVGLGVLNILLALLTRIAVESLLPAQ